MPRSRSSAASRFAAANRQGQRRGEPPRPLRRPEDVLLGMGAVRHLGGDVEPLGQQRGHRLVVLDALRLLGPARRDRPQRPGQQPVAARAGEPGVRVEVVAVGAEDAAELVGGVGDLDLDPGQAALEEGLEEGRAGRGVAGRRRAPRQRRLQPVLLVAVDQVVVVVAGEEDEPLPSQVLGDQPQQAVGRLDRLRRPSRRGSRRGRRGRSARRSPPAAAPGARGRTPPAAGPAPSRPRSGCRR